MTTKKDFKLQEKWDLYQGILKLNPFKNKVDDIAFNHVLLMKVFFSPDLIGMEMVSKRFKNTEYIAFAKEMRSFFKGKGLITGSDGNLIFDVVEYIPGLIEPSALFKEKFDIGSGKGRVDFVDVFEKGNGHLIVTNFLDILTELTLGVVSEFAKDTSSKTLKDVRATLTDASHMRQFDFITSILLTDWKLSFLKDGPSILVEKNGKGLDQNGVVLDIVTRQVQEINDYSKFQQDKTIDPRVVDFKHVFLHYSQFWQGISDAANDTAIYHLMCYLYFRLSTESGFDSSKSIGKSQEFYADMVKNTIRPILVESEAVGDFEERFKNESNGMYLYHRSNVILLFIFKRLIENWLKVTPKPKWDGTVREDCEKAIKYIQLATKTANLSKEKQFALDAFRKFHQILNAQQAMTFYMSDIMILSTVWIAASPKDQSSLPQEHPNIYPDIQPSFPTEPPKPVEKPKKEKPKKEPKEKKYPIGVLKDLVAALNFIEGDWVTKVLQSPIPANTPITDGARAKFFEPKTVKERKKGDPRGNWQLVVKRFDAALGKGSREEILDELKTFTGWSKTGVSPKDAPLWFEFIVNHL